MPFHLETQGLRAVARPLLVLPHAGVVAGVVAAQVVMGNSLEVPKCPITVPGLAVAPGRRCRGGLAAMPLKAPEAVVAVAGTHLNGVTTPAATAEA